MHKRRRLITIASILVIAEITNNYVVVQHLGGSLQVTDIIRFLMMTFFGINLALGKEWARIVIALLCFLGAAAAASVPFILQFNDVPASKHPFFFVSVSMCVIYLSTSIYLFASPGVSREIRRAKR